MNRTPVASRSLCGWSVCWRSIWILPVPLLLNTLSLAMQRSPAAWWGVGPSSSRSVTALWCTNIQWSRSLEPSETAFERASCHARRRPSQWGPILYQVYYEYVLFILFTVLIINVIKSSAFDMNLICYNRNLK